MTRAKPTSRKSTRPKAKPKAQRPAAKRAAAKRAGASRAKAAAKKRPATRKASPRKASSRKGSPRKTSTRAPRQGAAEPSRWVHFIEQFGVVLASARGPVPSIAEQIAGEPIVGSWWSHPKAHEIFEVLSGIDDDVDVRCFKLVDNKVTFVHRRLWPALVRLAREGVLAAERVASIQQEHMPTGEHRNVVTPFPDWVPEEAAEAADALSVEAARHRLGAWV